MSHEDAATFTLSHLVDVDAALTARAKAINPRVKRWYGTTTTTSVRTYKCYICGCIVDSDSAKYPKTKHALKALEKHKAQHLSLAVATVALVAVTGEDHA